MANAVSAVSDTAFLSKPRAMGMSDVGALAARPLLVGDIETGMAELECFGDGRVPPQNGGKPTNGLESRAQKCCPTRPAIAGSADVEGQSSRRANQRSKSRAVGKDLVGGRGRHE